jgi:hypothetical protein
MRGTASSRMLQMTYADHFPRVNPYVVCGNAHGPAGATVSP